MTEERFAKGRESPEPPARANQTGPLHRAAGRQDLRTRIVRRGVGAVRPVDDHSDEWGGKHPVVQCEPRSPRAEPEMFRRTSATIAALNALPVRSGLGNICYGVRDNVYLGHRKAVRKDC
jgi:hypothetical protein